MSYQKPIELVDAQQFMDKGEFKEALQVLKNLEDNQNLGDLDQLECHSLKRSALYELGRLEDAYTIAKQTYQESQKLGEDLQAIDSLILMARISFMLMKSDDFIKFTEQSEALLKSLTKESLLEIKKREGLISWLKGWISILQGDIEHSLMYAEQSLKLYEELNNKDDIAPTLTLIGEIYCLAKGELVEGLKYAEHSQEINKETKIKGFSYLISTATNSQLLGNIYAIKGELDLALTYFEKSLLIAEEFDITLLHSSTSNNIAYAHWLKGNLPQAIEIFEKELATGKHKAESWMISTLLSNLVEISIDRGNLDKANKYLEQLQELVNQEEAVFEKYTYRYCKALILKTSSRVRDLVKAEGLFKETVKEALLHELVINSLIHLCDLLLKELSGGNFLDILEELEPLVNQLLEFARKQHSYSVLGETYLLQTKIALINFDTKEARQLLTEAEKIAEQYGLYRLTIKISNEHDELLNNIALWDNLKQSESSLSERVELARLNEHMEQMVRKREIKPPKLVDEQPVLFTIITKEGNLVLSNPFTAEMSIDDKHLGMFLSSFETYSNEIFSESFDRVKFGDYTVIMKELEHFSICYMFLGKTYGARQKFLHFYEVLTKNSDIMNVIVDACRKRELMRGDDHKSIQKLILECFISDSKLFQVPFRAYIGEAPFTFVSYAHADKLEVYPIIDFLNKIGIHIWYDEGIPVSENWKKSIAENLERCSIFLVFISPHIIDSEYVRKEISFALKKKKKFIAVYLKETKLPTELEFEIADIQSIMKYLIPKAEFYDKLKGELS
ncbi:MAG: TIR domain-containing protein [Candidatus Hermodarchaeota archaeon]